MEPGLDGHVPAGLKPRRPDRPAPPFGSAMVEYACQSIRGGRLFPPQLTSNMNSCPPLALHPAQVPSAPFSPTSDSCDRLHPKSGFLADTAGARPNVRTLLPKPDRPMGLLPKFSLTCTLTLLMGCCASAMPFGAHLEQSGNGTWRVDVDSEVGVAYRLQTSTSLVDEWQWRGDEVIATGNHTPFPVSIVTTEPRRFWRVARLAKKIAFLGDSITDGISGPDYTILSVSWIRLEIRWWGEGTLRFRQAGIFQVTPPP